MIRYFRKIRRRQLDATRISNPASPLAKYLLYGAGEVFLVMIGILLALQVNNWNEGRKAKLSEIKFLHELNNDLKANQLEILGIQAAIERRIAAVDRVLSYLEDQDSVTEGLDTALFQVSAISYFNNSNTSYESLKASGMDFISNDSLRIRITKMYEEYFSNIQRREENETNLIRDHLDVFMRDHFIYKKGIAPSGRILYHPVAPVSYEKIQSSIKFRNLLQTLNSDRYLRLRMLDITINDLELLIRDVEKELNQN